MSAHTPGPWMLDGQTGSVWHEKVDRKNGLRLAVVDISSESESQDQANARLIAAAPDLLAALRALVPYAESRCEDMSEENEEDPLTVKAWRTLSNAVAAIAKARGES